MGQQNGSSHWLVIPLGRVLTDAGPGIDRLVDPDRTAETRDAGSQHLHDQQAENSDDDRDPDRDAQLAGRPERRSGAAKRGEWL